MEKLQSIKGILLSVMAVFSLTLSAALADLKEIEFEGGGDRIICNCTWNSNCKASGSSGVCAQSQPEGNIQCSSYNSNC